MNGAIILAAGRGRRMHADRNKQYLMLRGQTVLSYSLRTFAKFARIDRVIVVIHPDELDEARAAVEEAGLGSKLQSFIPGGAERQDSVRNALSAVPGEWRKILIHDGARPLVQEALIARVLEGVHSGVGVVPGIPLRDTVKRVDGKGQVQETLPRGELVAVQTPQGFMVDEIRAMHDKAHLDGLSMTDDAGLYEHYGYTVRVVEGDPRNLKITLKEDIPTAEVLLERLEGDLS